MDIPASHEIFERLVEPYRRIRNTLRFLLGNLYDYDDDRDAPARESLDELDRWVLSRLHALMTRVDRAYDSYQFHQVYQALHHFCAVELSSLYLDVRKDCLYTFAAGSAARRSTQFVMYRVLRALVCMMAPVLSHTAEEAWRSLRGEGEPESVFLTDWTEPEGWWRDEPLEADWEDLLELRERVTKRLEEMRASKEIGTSLEARVTLKVPAADDERWRGRLPQLPALFITSEVVLEEEEGLQRVEVDAGLAEGEKCQRCWNRRKAVGSDPDHPGLCDRCVPVVEVAAREA